jgi:hypothetical protein
MADVRVTFSEDAVRLLAETPEVQAAVDRTASELVSAMKARCPVSPVDSEHVSGHLRSSIHAFRTGDGVLIGPTASYAEFVIHGTPPHEIRSHGPWSLHSKATGKYFGRVVHHPGTSPQPFVAEALHEVAARHPQAG